VLTPAALARLEAAGKPLLGRSYDLYFGWADDRIYCSELIWKVYERWLHRRLGQLQQLRDFDLSHPAVQPSCTNGTAAACAGRNGYFAGQPLQQPRTGYRAQPLNEQACNLHGG
jgi:hypothetical protein